jgi:hypothetical protein
MGVEDRRFFEQKREFSPIKGIYPQFSTTYPHILADEAAICKD